MAPHRNPAVPCGTPPAIDRRLNPSLACERTDFYWDRVVRPRMFPSPQVSATSTLPAVLCAAALNLAAKPIGAHPEFAVSQLLGLLLAWAWPSFAGCGLGRHALSLPLDLLDACVWGDGCRANAAAFMALWAVLELSKCSAVNQSSRSPGALPTRASIEGSASQPPPWPLRRALRNNLYINACLCLEHGKDVSKEPRPLGRRGRGDDDEFFLRNGGRS